jgi:hypothetical protein
MHTQMHMQLRLQLTFNLFTLSAVMYTHPRKDDILEPLCAIDILNRVFFHICFISLVVVVHGKLGNKKLFQPSYPCVFSLTPRA